MCSALHAPASGPGGERALEIGCCVEVAMCVAAWTCPLWWRINPPLLPGADESRDACKCKFYPPVSSLPARCARWFCCIIEARCPCYLSRLGHDCSELIGCCLAGMAGPCRRWRQESGRGSHGFCTRLVLCLVAVAFMMLRWQACVQGTPGATLTMPLIVLSNAAVPRNVSGDTVWVVQQC